MEFDFLVVNKNRYFDGQVYPSVGLNFPKFMTSLVFKTSSVYDINIEQVIFNIDYSIMYMLFSSINELPYELAKVYEIYKAEKRDSLVSDTYVAVFRSTQEDYEAFYTNELKKFEDDIINLSSTRG